MTFKSSSQYRSEIISPGKLEVFKVFIRWPNMALYDVYFEPLQSALLSLTWKKSKHSDYLDLELLCSHDVFNIMICTLSRNLALAMTWFTMNHFETIPYKTKFTINGILKFSSVIFKFSQYTRSTKKQTIEQDVS